ncbi:inner centromere protein A-like [Drosophila madeirensis]|uniref:Inner centromere protein A-like n=1 Tax=Drosophila madeirensis TaxID=30013 RepID=A0AAU9FCY3_DROMD
MAFFDRTKAKGYFIPFKEVFKSTRTGICQATTVEKLSDELDKWRTATLSDERAKGATMLKAQEAANSCGCTFPLSPDSHCIGMQKGSPENAMYKDVRLNIKIPRSPKFDKEIKKIKRMTKGSSSMQKYTSPPTSESARITIKRSVVARRSPLSSTPKKTTKSNTGKSIRRSSIQKSPCTPLTGSPPKIIKRALKSHKSSSKKETPKSVSTTSPNVTPNKAPRMGIKRSPQLQKSSSIQSHKRILGGNNRLMIIQPLEVDKFEFSSSPDVSPNKDSLLGIKRTQKMPKPSPPGENNRKKNYQELQKSPVLVTTGDSPKPKKGLLKTNKSPDGIFKQNRRTNLKHRTEILKSPTTISSDERLTGSPEFYPMSSPEMNYNSDIMSSLSPFSTPSSADASTGPYRMTRRRSAEFHISPYESSPESCAGNKKRSIYDSTSDELRNRKRLLNLMHESYLRRTSSSSMPEDEDSIDFDTPTNVKRNLETNKHSQMSSKSQKEIEQKSWNWTFDDWLAYKKMQRQAELKRQEEERAYRDFWTAKRREISEGAHQSWLKKKQLEEEAKRVQKHMQLAALNASNSLKNNPIKAAPAKPKRNVSQEMIKQELDSWHLKKIEIEKAKRKEQQLALLKQEEEQFNRQRKSEMAFKKWFSTVHTKPKPVPMNQGLDSLRGTISKLYVNPQPWVTV